MVAAGLGSCGLQELDWAFVVQNRVPADAVVEHFDVLEDALTGFSSCQVILVVDQFFLKRAQETFHHRIIPAVPFATHAAGDSVAFKQSLIMLVGIFAAAIRVMQQPAYRPFPLESHFRGD